MLRETMNEIWHVLENDPSFEFVPYYLGLMAVVTIIALKSRGGWGDGGGAGGDGCGGGGGGDGG